LHSPKETWSPHFAHAALAELGGDAVMGDDLLAVELLAVNAEDEPDIINGAEHSSNSGKSSASGTEITRTTTLS
jgi:hypothetical protein